MMFMKKKCVVVDLDETLFKGNTFHIWLKFLLKEISHKEFHIKIKLLFFIFLRLVRVISHYELKKQTLIISNSQKNKIDLDKYLYLIDLKINKIILKKINNKLSNHVWILATAAPAIYSESIAQKYNFDYCLSTSMEINDEWVENIREIKLKNVKQLIRELKINTIDELYTDHHDDIPLMKESKKIVLVNPTENSIKKIQKNEIIYSVIN